MTQEDDQDDVRRRIEGLEQKVNGGDKWDGGERRAVQAGTAASAALGKQMTNALEHSQPPPISYVWGVVVLGSIIALQCLILILMFRLSDNQQRAESSQRVFRDAVVCYVIEVTRTPTEPPPADILTKCNFISVPGR